MSQHNKVLTILARSRSPHAPAVEQALLDTAQQMRDLGRYDMAEFLDRLASGGITLSADIQLSTAPEYEDTIQVDFTGMPVGMVIAVKQPENVRLHRALHGWSVNTVVDKVKL